MGQFFEIPMTVLGIAIKINQILLAILVGISVNKGKKKEILRVKIIV